MKINKFTDDLQFKKHKVFLLVLPKDEMDVKNKLKIICEENGFIFMDYKEFVIKDIEENYIYKIGIEREIFRLHDICKDNKGQVLILHNFDLIISHFGSDDRKELWRRLLDHVIHPVAVLGIPIHEESGLLPKDMTKWRDNKRVLELVS